jgi:hypothetical protein
MVARIVPDDGAQEARGEEVIANISGAEGQSSVGVALLGGGQRDLAVLDNLCESGRCPTGGKNSSKVPRSVSVTEQIGFIGRT